MSQDTTKTFELMSSTMPIRMLRPLWGVLTELDRVQIRDQLFNKFNLNKKRLMSDERLTLEIVLNIFSFCEENSVSEVGFLTGLSSKYGQFGAFDYYLSSLNTMGDMLKSLKHYFPVITTEKSLLAITQRNEENFQLSLPKSTDSTSGSKLFNDMLLGILIRTIKVHSGKENLLPSIVSFPYINLPKSIVLYLTNKKIKVQLNKCEYELVFPTKFLAMELQYRDPMIAEQLKSTLESLLVKTQSEDTVTNRVVALLSQSDDLARVSLITIADELSMSQSSLKRKLADEGNSFSLLLSRYKQSHAMEMVTSSDTTLSDIANMLGYSDRTAFERAFKDWFGISPSQIRQQILTSSLPNNISNPIDSNNFPAAPDVFIKLMTMLDSDEHTINDISDLIESDPVLTGKLLGIASSAYYGYRDVSNVSSAINELFGLTQTRNFVLSIMSNNQFDTSQCQFLDLQLYWTHATATYECIKIIAESMEFKTQAEKERFYLSALLHRVFELVYASKRPEDMKQYLTLIKDNDLIINTEACQRIEEQIFGIVGYQTTALLLAHWGIPADVHKTIREMSFEKDKQSLNAKVLNYVSNSFRYTIYSEANEAQKEEVLQNLSELLYQDYDDIRQKIEGIEDCLAEIGEQAKSMF